MRLFWKARSAFIDMPIFTRLFVCVRKNLRVLACQIIRLTYFGSKVASSSSNGATRAQHRDLHTYALLGHIDMLDHSKIHCLSCDLSYLAFLII
jgi:hypothetical protein